MKLFISMFLLVLLSGCSNGINISVPDRLAQSESNNGYVTGSLGVTTEWPSTGEGLVTTLYLRQQGSADPITVTSSKSDFDYNNGLQKGQLFTIALPPGQYELYSISFRGSNGIQSVESKTKDNLNIAFTVRPAQVTYIGQFLTSSLVAKSTLWNTLFPSGYGVVTHSDASQRDKSLFDKHNPNLRTMSFVISPLTGLTDSRIPSTVTN